jgi:sugar O-acyltransferase (sialic acid O-acetyltransferase NeuD family)
MVELLIWGAGGHAAVVADIARLAGWTVLGFIDDRPGGGAGTVWAGLPVLDGAAAEALVHGGVRHAAVAIGDPRVRLAKASLLESWGCTLSPLVHPRAVVADSAELEAGVVVCAGAVVGPLARLGRLGIVNTLASADHECDLAEAVHLCPGSHLAGRVAAGAGVWLGVGACVRDRVRLGAWCYVGAGAAVVADLPVGCLAVGVPARPRGTSPFALSAAEAA